MSGRHAGSSHVPAPSDAGGRSSVRSVRSKSKSPGPDGRRSSRGSKAGSKSRSGESVMSSGVPSFRSSNVDDLTQDNTAESSYTESSMYTGTDYDSDRPPSEPPTPSPVPSPAPSVTGRSDLATLDTEPSEPPPNGTAWNSRPKSDSFHSGVPSHSGSSSDGKSGKSGKSNKSLKSIPVDAKTVARTAQPERGSSRPVSTSSLPKTGPINRPNKWIDSDDDAEPTDPPSNSDVPPKSTNSVGSKNASSKGEVLKSARDASRSKRRDDEPAVAVVPAAKPSTVSSRPVSKSSIPPQPVHNNNRHSPESMSKTGTDYHSGPPSAMASSVGRTSNALLSSGHPTHFDSNPPSKVPSSSGQVSRVTHSGFASRAQSIAPPPVIRSTPHQEIASMSSSGLEPSSPDSLPDSLPPSDEEEEEEEDSDDYNPSYISDNASDHSAASPYEDVSSVVSSISGPSFFGGGGHRHQHQHHQHQHQPGASKSGAETSAFGDDESDDDSDEDHLPPPPHHLLTKSHRAPPSLSNFDLDHGLLPNGPRTVLKLQANPGQNVAMVMSDTGFQPGMWIVVGAGPNRELFQMKAKGSLVLDRNFKFAWPAGTVVEGSWSKPLGFDPEPPTPETNTVITTAMTSDTPTEDPDEPRTPSSYQYSGYPSPPGSVSGFSVRSQQAMLEGPFFHRAGLYGDRPGDVSPHPRSISSLDSGPYQGASTSKLAAARKLLEAVKAGYQPIKAKFEAIGEHEFPNDDFEDMLYKYAPPNLCLMVEANPGDPVLILVEGGHTYVVSDGVDLTHCYMETRPEGAPATLLSFKTATDKAMDAFIDSLPPEVLEYPDDEASNEEKGADYRYNAELRDTSGNGNIKQQMLDAKRKNLRAGRADALAAAEAFPDGMVPFGKPPGPPPTDLEHDLIAPPATPRSGELFDRPPPPQRSELIAARIRKSMPSVRRVRLLCRWLDNLRFWPTKVTITNMHKEICSGLLLIDLMKMLLPATTFVNVNKNSLCKHSACQNLNQALTVIFQSKTFNAARIPSPDDIFNGNMTKITTLVDEIFNVYARAPLYQPPSFKMLQWYNGILRAYQMPLPREILEEGDVSSRDQLWKHFRSGVAIFCVLFHFYGPCKIPVCKKHSSRNHQGELVFIENDEWAKAPPHVREMVEVDTVKRAIQSVNRELARKKEYQLYGHEFTGNDSDDYAPHLTLDQLKNAVKDGNENIDDDKALCIINALVYFHRLAETHAGARGSGGHGSGGEGGVHYQAYCDRCAHSIRIDPMRVVRKPVGFTDVKANVTYVFSLLRALKIDVVWDVDEWLTFPDADFMLLQLWFIYEALRSKQGVLPAASGKEAGYTSGPNGEMLIVGIVFADTNPVLKILPAIERGSKTVLLGAGFHDIPFTPIDFTAAEDAQAALAAKVISQAQYDQYSRFFVDECPLGMLSDHVTIAKTPHALDGAAQSLAGGLRSQHHHGRHHSSAPAPWNNQSAQVDEDPRRLHVVDILKKSHQRTDPNDAHSIHKVAADGGATRSSKDFSKMQSTARQSRLNKSKMAAAAGAPTDTSRADATGAAAGGTAAAGRPASPSRRVSVASVDRQGRQQKTVVIDSAEQEEHVRQELLRNHRKNVLAQLDDDKKKAENQLQDAELILEADLEHYEDTYQQRMDRSNPDAPDPIYDRDLAKHTAAKRAIDEDRDRVMRFFQMRREAIEEQYNEFKMQSVTFARRSDHWTLSTKEACHADLLISAAAGSTTLELSSFKGFSVGQRLDVGTGAMMDTVRLVEITTHGASVATTGPAMRVGSKTREAARKLAIIEPPLRHNHARGTLIVGVVTVSTLAVKGASSSAIAAAGAVAEGLVGTAQVAMLAAAAGSLREKMTRLSTAAQGRATASKQLKVIQLGDGTVTMGGDASVDGSSFSLASGMGFWDSLNPPDERQRKTADLMLKQVHLGYYAPQPTAAERREHAKFATEAEERRAVKTKADLDRRLPNNNIHLAWVGDFVDHSRKTKAALDKRFPGNSIPLEYVEDFVVREMRAARRDEQGWNLAHTKLHTYNASIKKKTDINSKLLQESWTPEAQRKQEALEREKMTKKARSMLGLLSSDVDSLHVSHTKHSTAAAVASGLESSSSSVASGNNNSAGGGARPGHSRAKLHADMVLSQDPEEVFHRFKVKLIAQNHVYGKKQSLGFKVKDADTRNSAERTLDKIAELGVAVGKKRDVPHWFHRLPGETMLEMTKRLPQTLIHSQWIHRRTGETTLKLVQRVSDCLLRHVGDEKQQYLAQLLELDDPFAEYPEAGPVGHLSATAKALGAKIRDDELMCMLLEDVRGDLLCEEGFKKEAPKPAPAAPPAPAIVPAHLAEYQARAKVEQEAAEARRLREENVDTAMQYLREAHLFALADRNAETEFFFAVSKVGGKDYLLHWSKPGDDSNERLCWLGYLALADIKSVAEAPPVEKRGALTLGVDNQNAKALRGCGGRTKVVLKGDAAELAKFRQRLGALAENM